MGKWWCYETTRYNYCDERYIIETNHDIEMSNIVMDSLLIEDNSYLRNVSRNATIIHNVLCHG